MYPYSLLYRHYSPIFKYMGAGCGCLVIDESEVGIIERMGKYDRIEHSGCSYISPCFERVIKQSLRLVSKNFSVETITSEQLSIKISIGIQYKINSDNIMPLSNGDLLDDNDISLTTTSEQITDKTKPRSHQNSHSNSHPIGVYEQGKDNPIYRATYLTRDPVTQMTQIMGAYLRSVSQHHTMREIFMSKKQAIWRNGRYS